MLNKISLKIRNIKYGIKNLIRWFPIIWKDRNWDYCYLLMIMEKKISFLADDIERVKFYYGYEADVESMRKVVKLLHKVREGDYLDEARKFLGEKYTPESLVKMEAELFTKDCNEIFKILSTETTNWWW